MTRAVTPAPSVERLAGALLPPGGGGRLRAELLDWLSTSARFRSFAEANQAKIRKKLRGARDDDSLRDVRAELRAAHLLLSDKRIELAYEAYGSANAGPDFTITFRGTRTFNVEVTRLRRLPEPAGAASPIVAKLRQLPPSVPNVLVIAVDADSATRLDVSAAVRTLRARADAKDDAFFAAYGLTGTRAVNERFLRLGAVIAWSEGAATADDRAAIWSNAAARIALDPRATDACVRCFRADA